MKYEVVNIVATANIGINLNLSEVGRVFTSLGEVKYVPKKFPALIIKLRRGVTALVFTNGKVTVVGAKTVNEVRETVKELLLAIMKFTNYAPKSVEVKIQNIIATANLGTHVNLENLSTKLSNALYVPEQFSGLIYKPDIPLPTVLIFSTGSVVIVGAKTEKEIEEVLSRVKQVI